MKFSRTNPDDSRILRLVESRRTQITLYNKEKAIEKFTIISTTIEVRGHCPFQIEGTDEEGFDFTMTVIAKWIDGEMDDILYSPIKGEWIELRYMKPGYDHTEESLDDHCVEWEWIDADELARRAGDFSVFKLCDCLDEEEAEQAVWNNLLARQYDEEEVIIRSSSEGPQD